MDKKRLLDKIETSRLEVKDAEDRLAKVLQETTRGPRAEKTTIAGSLQEAMAKLKAARTDLEELAHIVAEEED